MYLNTIVMSRIPTLDIRRFNHPASAEDRAAFVQELAATYREWGFAGICGHDVADELVDAAYADFQAFFALPENVKKRYRLEGKGGARGYTPFGIETAKGAQHHDLKEFWHIGREIDRASRHAEVMPANVWPEEVPGFRENGYALYQALDKLGSQVLAALALSLDLPEN